MPNFTADNLRQAADALDQLTQLNVDSAVDVAANCPPFKIDDKLLGYLRLEGEEDPAYQLWIDVAS